MECVQLLISLFRCFKIQLHKSWPPGQIDLPGVCTFATIQSFSHPEDIDTLGSYGPLTALTDLCTVFWNCPEHRCLLDGEGITWQLSGTLECVPLFRCTVLSQKFECCCSKMIDNFPPPLDQLQQGFKNFVTVTPQN